MITIQTLTATGSIDALLTLAGGPALTARQVSEHVDASLGTVRSRLNALVAEGLLYTDAAMVDGSPTMVYAVTDDGAEVADALADIITVDEAGSEATPSPVDEAELDEE